MNSDNESHSQKVDGFPVVLVNPEEMVVELVDLAPHTLIPAEAAFEALAEAHTDLEVPAVDVNDAAARTVDLPHGTLSERREIERAGRPLPCISTAPWWLTRPTATSKS